MGSNLRKRLEELQNDYQAYLLDIGKSLERKLSFGKKLKIQKENSDITIPDIDISFGMCNEILQICVKQQG